MSALGQVGCGRSPAEAVPSWVRFDRTLALARCQPRPSRTSIQPAMRTGLPAPKVRGDFRAEKKKGGKKEVKASNGRQSGEGGGRVGGVTRGCGLLFCCFPCFLRLFCGYV